MTEGTDATGMLASLHTSRAGIGDISSDEPAAAARLRGILEAFMRTAPDLLQRVGKAKARVSSADERRLKALGYLK